MCCCVMAVLITAHFSSCFVIVSFMVCEDVTNSGNGERGTGNRERESGN